MAEQVHLISPEEYLAAEETSQVKHEYIDGYTYAMAGATDAQAAIVWNLTVLVGTILRGTPCRGRGSDTKIRVQEGRKFYHPDLSITCDEPMDPTCAYMDRPQVIIEVLSEATEAFDRGLKMEHYQALESLQEYILIAQDRVSATCYRKSPDGWWRMSLRGPGDDLVLESVDFYTPMEAIYEGVVFPPAPGLHFVSE